VAPEFGPEGGPAVDDTRYLEIWNLVFMQYLIDNVRSKIDFDIQGELPQKNIDTGMGMERVAFIKQDVANMYEIDQVRPVLDAAEQSCLASATAPTEATMCACGSWPTTFVQSLMLMTDGVAPSNDQRGYVLRRLLRRSIRSMRLLGVHEPSFEELFTASRDAMSRLPGGGDEFSRTLSLATAEEESFLGTSGGGNNDS
jgi:alanyl-tRNA synthetase